MKKFIFLKQEIYEILNKEVAGDVDIINIFDSVCAHLIIIWHQKK